LLLTEHGFTEVELNQLEYELGNIKQGLSYSVSSVRKIYVRQTARMSRNKVFAQSLLLRRRPRNNKDHRQRRNPQYPGVLVFRIKPNLGDRQDVWEPLTKLTGPIDLNLDPAVA
jgi:hypothetical protein